MNDNKKNGMSFIQWLQPLFIALKLTGAIKWSWAAVLSPFWITFIIIALAALTVTIADLDDK